LSLFIAKHAQSSAPEENLNSLSLIPRICQKIEYF